MKNKFLILILLFNTSLLFGQSIGDYRTTTGGIWGFITWETYNGSSWISASAPTNITSTVTIYHDISILLSTVSINTGGKLVIAPTGKLSNGNTPIANNVGTGGLVIQASAAGSGQYVNLATINATRETFLTANKWHLIGMPFDGISTTTYFDGFYMQQYVQYDNTWIWNDEVGFNPTMSLGYGYSAWKDTDATISVAGSLIASDVTVSLADRSGMLGDSRYGFNLLSNPYSSGLIYTNDWTRTNVNDAIYIWDQATLGGSYLTYNAGNSYIIKASQGFFMQANNNGSVVMKNGARTVVNSQNPMKSSAIDEIKRARLLIQNTANNYGDELQFEFNDIANMNFNGETDASKMYGSDVSPDLFMLTGDDVPVAIKGLDPSQNSTVRMQLKPNVDATYRITAKEFTFDPTTEILLEDLFTQTIMPVNANLDYTFSSLSTDNESRFVVYVKPSTTGTDQTKTESKFTIFGSNEQLRIISNENNYKVSVFNLLGQKLVEKNNLIGNSSIDLSAFKQTIVLVSIQSENESISKKIQLK